MRHDGDGALWAARQPLRPWTAHGSALDSDTGTQSTRKSATMEECDTRHHNAIDRLRAVLKPRQAAGGPTTLLLPRPTSAQQVHAPISPARMLFPAPEARRWIRAQSGAMPCPLLTQSDKSKGAEFSGSGPLAAGVKMRCTCASTCTYRNFHHTNVCSL